MTMLKTNAVRYTDFPDGSRLIERLYTPDRGESDLQKEEWREEFRSYPEIKAYETENSAVSDFSKVQVSKAWPFPESYPQ